jgi:hypothetical protein
MTRETVNGVFVFIALASVLDEDFRSTYFGLPVNNIPGLNRIPNVDGKPLLLLGEQASDAGADEARAGHQQGRVRPEKDDVGGD